MSRKSLFLIPLFAMAFAFATANVQAEKPIAEISIGSYQSITSGFETVGSMLDNPQIKRLPALLEQQVGNDIVKTIAKDQPAGALIYKADNKKDDSPISYLIFLPVSNSKPILAKLEDDDSLDIDKGFEFQDVKMVKITRYRATVYLVTSNGWTFLSDKPSRLLNLPKKPASLLGDLPQKYIFAIKVNVDAVPENAKNWVFKQIEDGMKAAGPQNPYQQSQLDNIKRYFYELKTLVIGFGLDKSKKTLYFDADIVPTKGSEFAKQVEAMKSAKPFGNVILSGATAYSTAAGVADEKESKKALENISTLFENISQLIDDSDIEDKDKLSTLIEKTSKFLKNNIKANAGQVVRGGTAFFFKEDELSCVVAIENSDIEDIDALIKDWVKAYVKNANKYFKANVETWNGLTFNVATISTQSIIDSLKKQAGDSENEKIMELEQTLQAAFGDNIEIVYAVGKDKFYFAAGKNAIQLIKRTHRNTKAVVPNGYQSFTMIDIQEILTTLSKITFIPENGRDMLDAIANAAAGEDNQGKIYMGAKFNDKGGIVMHLEVEAGIVRAIQAGVALSLMNNGEDDSDDEDEEYDFTP